MLAGARGKVHGPSQVLIRIPKFAALNFALGGYFRGGGLLQDSDLELAILATSQACEAKFIWTVHEPRALKVGVRSEAVDAARLGARNALLEPREQTILNVARSLVKDHKLDDSLYSRALQIFGEQPLVELVAIVGFYTLIAIVLGGFAVEPSS